MCNVLQAPAVSPPGPEPHPGVATSSCSGLGPALCLCLCPALSHDAGPLLASRPPSAMPGRDLRLRPHRKERHLTRGLAPVPPAPPTLPLRFRESPWGGRGRQDGASLLRCAVPPRTARLFLPPPIRLRGGGASLDQGMGAPCTRTGVTSLSLGLAETGWGAGALGPAPCTVCGWHAWSSCSGLGRGGGSRDSGLLKGQGPGAPGQVAGSTGRWLYARPPP